MKTHLPFSCLLLLPAFLRGIQAEPKASIPQESEQKEALKMIREVFKEDYAKRSPKDRTALARTLLQQGSTFQDNRSSQYVMLQQARTLATEAGDLSLALRAVEELSRHFDVRTLELEYQVLSACGAQARTAADGQQYASSLLRLGERAMAIWDYETAEKALSAAKAQAKKGNHPPLSLNIESKSRLLGTVKTKGLALKKAWETLAVEPQDPQANSLVGQYLSFIREDWEKGLQHLVKGPDAPLKEAATLDMANPEEPDKQVQTGDAWWALAEKETGDVQRNLKRRAERWYAPAVSRLAGLQKTRVEKRISAARLERLSTGTWSDITDPACFRLDGKKGSPIVLPAKRNTREEAVLGRWPEGISDGLWVRVKYETPGPGTGYLFINESWRIWVNQDSGDIAASSYFDNMVRGVFGKKGTVRDEYVIVVLFGPGGFTTYLDGVEAGRVTTDQERLTRLTLEALGGPVSFDQIRLRRKE